MFALLSLLECNLVLSQKLAINSYKTMFANKVS